MRTTKQMNRPHTSQKLDKEMPDNIIRLISEHSKLGTRIVSITERFLQFEQAESNTFESIREYFKEHPLTEEQLEELAACNIIEAEEVPAELEDAFVDIEIDTSDLPPEMEFSEDCIPQVANRIREVMELREFD